MKCKACNRNIKHENGRWHHYQRQTRFAVPNYTPHIKITLLCVVVGIIFLYIGMNMV